MSVMPAPSIPAWKRLGLKLKSDPSAQASSAATTGIPEEVPTPKRKRIGADSEFTPKSKKVKNASKNTANKDLTVAEAPKPPPSTPQLSRKKSVTFTPETKVDDGESIKQLFNAWLAQERAKDPTFAFTASSNQALDVPEPPRVEETIDIALPESERRVKRVKKPVVEESGAKDTKRLKVKKSKVAKPVTTYVPPFLVYLRQYHESRDSWKFNKNHQNHLLKHVFDLEILPSDHIHLIYEYIKGLQGGVRTRLRDAALAVKVKDQEDAVAGFPEGIKDGETKQTEYDNAIKEYVAARSPGQVPSKEGSEVIVLAGLSDDAMAERAAKRIRAEQILMQLGMPELVPDVEMVGGTQNQKGLQVDDGAVPKVTRKRKRRTTAVDDSSSSSSSDSSSDSESEEETEKVESSGSSSDTSMPLREPRPADESSGSSSASSSSSSSSSSSDDSDSD